MRRVWVTLLTCVCAMAVAGGQAPAPPKAAAPSRARNVILFIGDAGGLPTLNAASLYGYDRPQALFIQHMPHVALMDTSAADGWVTDSAAGMTAIVTGRKTNNGVLSQSDTAVRGKQDGDFLKTILEYAEERGLATGLISNDSLAGATPAACFAHTNSRSNVGEILAQFLAPRAGDGVDLVAAGGRKSIYLAAAKQELDLDAALRARGYAVLDSPESLRPDTTRAMALTDASDFNLDAVVQSAMAALSRNRQGYFLMVEWDLHTDNQKVGLDRTLVLDAVVRKTVDRAGAGTLVIFAADHSFDIRLRGGKQGRPLLPDSSAGAPAPADAPLRMDNGHTGEEVVVAAQGPGAERVRGFLANTDLFQIMLAAYGWREPAARR